MHSQYDAPKLVAKASIPQDIELLNIEAWNDHPLVIQAIKEKIDEAMNS